MGLAKTMFLAHGDGQPVPRSTAPDGFARFRNRPAPVSSRGAYRANQLPLTATIETWGARDRALPTPGFIVEFD